MQRPDDSAAPGARDASPARPALSIVIPAYDEAARIGATLRAIAAHLRGELESLEVLVVDDGSQDGTAEVAEKVGAELGLRLRALGGPRNRGKGHAVRCGMLEAQGDVILCTDADLSVSIDQLDRFRERLAEGPDAVFGSRRATGAHIARHQPALRERLGTAFRDLARVLVCPGISDFTCGFKLFRREAARLVFAPQRISGWGYDVENALIARRRGLRVVEEPVVWRDDTRTRVRLLRDVARSAADLARIRWHDLRGRY